MAGSDYPKLRPYRRRPKESAAEKAGAESGRLFNSMVAEAWDFLDAGNCAEANVSAIVAGDLMTDAMSHWARAGAKPTSAVFTLWMRDYAELRRALEKRCPRRARRPINGPRRRRRSARSR